MLTKTRQFLLAMAVSGTFVFTACGGGTMMPPPATKYTIGGTISGLSGTVVLQDNLADDLTITANGSFAFATPLTAGSTYSVTVKTQPTGQTCTVSSGTGTANANVTSVGVSCSANATYTIGGTVSGLAGTVVLEDNLSDDLTITANGSFTFNTALSAGSTYSVTVKTQPTGQTCSVSSGNGTANANVTNVGVTCGAIPTYTIGGTVSGLSGTVVLQDNLADNLTITANGGFTFATALTAGSTYSVTVKTQPTGQTCNVTSGNGTANANVTNVSVSCTTNTYTIGGTVSGLSGTVVLQDNLTNNLTITTNGSFTFSTALTAGSTYSVTVKTQPTGQTCTVSNGSGTANANVTTVGVSCSAIPTYTIGGTVSGLSGTVVLQDNLSDNLTITTNGSFTFGTALTAGSTYSVTVKTQPTGQTCNVSNGNGTANANVTTVSVSCTTNTYTIGGTVSGLSGTVVLQDNLTNNLTITTNGSFTFSAALTAGSTYSVTVKTQPTGQTCSVTNGNGTANANVTNVGVTCSAVTYTIGGTVSGLSGTVVLQDNLTDNLTITTNGSFTFSTALAAGSTYSVTVKTQPSGQTCNVTNGNGTANANVTNVSVSCTTNTYTIGGTVSGLTGTLVLQDNLTDNLTITTNGSFTFSTALTAGSTYSVTVKTQPTGQTCNVTNGNGTANANVTNVSVNCTTNTYTIGGTVSGLSGTVVLQDNLTDNLTITTNGSFTFSTALTAGSTYSVTVKTQPTGQTCNVTNGNGTANANVTNVSVTCSGSVSFTSISPATIGAGTPSFLLTVVGTGFTSGTDILFNGSALASGTTFVDSAHLTTIVPYTDIETAGSATITVSGDSSDSLKLTISGAATPSSGGLTVTGVTLAEPVRLASDSSDPGALYIAELGTAGTASIIRLQISTGAATSWATLPVYNNGYTGLLGFAPDPANPPTASGGSFYVFYTNSSTENRIGKVAFHASSVTDLAHPIHNLPAAASGEQQWLNGGKLAVHLNPVSSTNHIFASTGGSDNNPQWSQDDTLLNGKILRYNTDGSIPSDNPFGNGIYACGFRNSFGFDFHPTTDAAYATDNGNNASSSGWFDALDRVLLGDDEGYGFTSSAHCQSSSISPLWGGTANDAPQEIAPSGTAFYPDTFPNFPQWQNTILVSGYNSQSLYQFSVDEYGPTDGTGLATGELLPTSNPATAIVTLSGGAVLSDIAVLPDGCVYVASVFNSTIYRIGSSSGTCY